MSDREDGYASVVEGMLHQRGKICLRKEIRYAGFQFCCGKSAKFKTGGKTFPNRPIRTKWKMAIDFGHNNLDGKCQRSTEMRILHNSSTSTGKIPLVLFQEILILTAYLHIYLNRNAQKLKLAQNRRRTNQGSYRNYRESRYML